MRPPAGNWRESVCDFSRSFLQFTTDFSNHTPRMQLEASCLVSDAAGRTVEYVLTCDCMSEHMYRPSGLVAEPTSLFWLISGDDGEFLMQKRHRHAAQDIREAHRVGQRFSSHDGRGRTMLKIEVQIQPAPAARPLLTYPEIRQAILGNRPLSGRTTYQAPGGGLRVRLEYPIKTCNIAHGHEGWQVDTGPIVLPDPAGCDRIDIRRLESAFILFNSPDWAELAARRTGAADPGAAPITHFSEIVRLEGVKNELFALE